MTTLTKVAISTAKFRETTQFSMVEFNDFVASGREAKTPREKAMDGFKASLAKEGVIDSFKVWGGLSNLQRVRVLQDPEKPDYLFDFVWKLPPHVLEERKHQAEQEARRAKELERRAQLLTKVEELKNDPRKLEKFARDVTDIIVRAAAVLALGVADLKKMERPPTKKPVKKVARSVEPKKSPWELALAQDRRNRIEASKRAAATFHAKKETKAS